MWSSVFCPPGSAPGVIAGCDFRARMPPLRFFVERLIGEFSQRTNSPAIDTDAAAGYLRSRRLIHEGHKFVWKSWHGTANTDSADIGTPADPCHPAAFRHVAVHNRPP